MAGNDTTNKEHPLAGVVLCLTSVLPEQRTELATIAGQMGATHKLDLTSDVTHLIVAEVNTKKYKFVARNRPDVAVLRPEWVEAVRQAWMQGEDADVRKLEEQHKLPTFEGLVICITGFEDTTLRNYIEDMAVANGAKFRKDLTKSVSHLVARNAEGQKYKFATQWDIKVVSMKWFSDSLERGMVLEETIYHPLVPPEGQGVGAWDRAMPTVKEKPSSVENASNPRPRKLRRIASAKLEHQNEGIWGDIVGTGFDNSDPKGPNANQQKNGDSAPAKDRPVLQVAKSFASTTPFPESQSEGRQKSPETTTESDGGFLHGCYFFIYGFSSKQTSVLRQHLTFNGAQVLGSLSEFSRSDIPKTGHGLYTIVSHRTPRSEIPNTDDMAFECEVVTDMWLERCLDAKSLVLPESHVANTPVPIFPIPGFGGVKICSTGFIRIDLLHLSKLVTLIGASYNEYMTPNASVLVCNDLRTVNQDKLRHALEWGLPAVSRDWLWDSIRAGEKKPFEPYTVKKQVSRTEKVPEKRGSTPVHTNDSRQTGTSSQPVEINEDFPDIFHGKDAEKQPKHTNGDHVLREKNKQQQIPQKIPSIPQSRSSSPATKNQTQSTTTARTDSFSLSTKRQDSYQTSSASTDLAAVTGLLNQARAATSRSAADTGNQQKDNNNNGRRIQRKRLLGRAPSHSSTHPTTTFSRASSVSTLNDDGCGSIVESETVSHANSRNGQHPSTTSLFADSRFDFIAGGYPRINEEDEDDAPPMTQLGYEDPDAVAMRKQFLRGAGKLVDNEEGDNNGAGEKEKTNPETRQALEDVVGWGSGRRTRRTNRQPADGLEDF